MYISELLQTFDIETILDVGANVGQFARSMREIGYRGQIISCEPVSAEFRALERASAGDPNWKALQVALGVNTETASINVMQASVLSSFRQPLPSSAETHRGFSSNNRVKYTEAVSVRRLDDIVDELGLSTLRC